jgi:hypothetical protein
VACEGVHGLRPWKRALLHVARHRRRQRRPHRVEARRCESSAAALDLAASASFSRFIIILPALMVEELPESAAAGEHARQNFRRAAAHLRCKI